ncbi:hypothetical protein JXQ31_00300 [candidate division KSB1 bacterium]|nr:hypothetical protein [candidate division KSB1 bacterium]
MENVKSLPRANWVRHIGIPVMILLFAGAITYYVIGEITFHFLLIIIMLSAALMHLMFLSRTRNRDYLIPLLFYLFTALTFVFISINNNILTVFFAVCALFLFVMFMRMLVLRRLKWRYREVLELAASSVNETKNGFTPRPYPAGQINFSKEEIIRFARFMLKNVIAFPYIEETRVVLVIPENMLPHFLYLKQNYLNETFIVFNYDGQVSVKIAKKDYQKYSSELTFDQLCSSFANLFVEFLKLLQNGKSDKIIEQMNSLKLVL